MANEKRLIDANKIQYHKSGFPKGDGFDSRLDWAFREDIDKLPTVDAVEVVRCKDCKHFVAPQGVPVEVASMVMALRTQTISVPTEKGELMADKVKVVENDPVREKLIELYNKLEEEGLAVVAGKAAMADLMIANGATVQKWIPVTERLPEVVSTHKAWRNTYRSSERVLCACKQKSGKQMVKEGYMEFFNDYPEPTWRIPGSIDSVTHWMPLPESPKGE